MNPFAPIHSIMSKYTPESLDIDAELFIVSIYLAICRAIALNFM